MVLDGLVIEMMVLLNVDLMWVWFSVMFFFFLWCGLCVVVLGVVMKVFF